MSFEDESKKDNTINNNEILSNQIKEAKKASSQNLDWGDYNNKEGYEMDRFHFSCRDKYDRDFIGRRRSDRGLMRYQTDDDRMYDDMNRDEGRRNCADNWDIYGDRMGRERSDEDMRDRNYMNDDMMDRNNMSSDRMNRNNMNGNRMGRNMNGDRMDRNQMNMPQQPIQPPTTPGTPQRPI